MLHVLLLSCYIIQNATGCFCLSLFSKHIVLISNNRTHKTLYIFMIVRTSRPDFDRAIRYDILRLFYVLGKICLIEELIITALINSWDNTTLLFDTVHSDYVVVESKELCKTKTLDEL